MGKLVVTEFISIEGAFEDPGGAEKYEHRGWMFGYDRGEDGNTFQDRRADGLARPTPGKADL
jgi:hypothetical protein